MAIILLIFSLLLLLDSIADWLRIRQLNKRLDELEELINYTGKE